MRPKPGQRFDIILIGIVLLSAFLNVFNIWNDQYANSYYTSAVTSMLQSWHNFFYASFDPGGYITVDKPPFAFWVQTLFAYIFGVRGWSVILPQALAGVGSVLLMYVLVKPAFGKTAARLASLVMACTPIAAAVSRTNNIDSLLVFALLLATWMLFKAVREQKLVWVLGAFAMIGVGFNMKMLQAYMVVPAFYLFYLLAFRGEWKKKLAVLTAATVVMVGVSLSWAVIVDAIPAENRPYIGGSQTNSVLELALGYNGVSRLTGMNQGGGGPDGAPADQQQTRPEGDGAINQQTAPPAGSGAVDQPTTPPDGSGQIDQPTDQPGGNAPGGFDPNGNERQRPADGPGGNAPQGQRMGGGSFGTGQAGPLRLLQTELAGQISWLLPFVVFAAVGLLAGISRRAPLTVKQNETLFWLAWLIPGMVFFSIAGFFHHYYLIMLAPPIAALAGAGWVELWNQYRNQEGWKRWLLPAGLLSTTVFELVVLQPYQAQIGIGWSIAIGAAGIGLSLVLFFAARKTRLSSIAAAAGMLVLLAAPLYWAATPLLYGGNSMLPQAGPSQAGFGMRTGMGGGMNSGGVNTQLLEYVTRNNTGETYLFATTDSNTAAPYIIETGQAVIAMGGFSGSDPVLTVEKLQQMTANHEVKYFLISSGAGGRGGASDVMSWIIANSTEVPREEWQNGSAHGDAGGMRDAAALYQINQ